jgi:hypothetical protein
MSNRISGQMPARAVATPTAYTSADADKIAELEARIATFEKNLAALATIVSFVDGRVEDLVFSKSDTPTVEVVVTPDVTPIAPETDVTGGVTRSRKPAAKSADK